MALGLVIAGRWRKWEAAGQSQRPRRRSRRGFSRTLPRRLFGARSHARSMPNQPRQQVLAGGEIHAITARYMLYAAGQSAYFRVRILMQSEDVVADRGEAWIWI